ncbi:MAG TPA: hypothetical protein VHN11_13420 [Xanthobacteraceae bacterium]|jgi:hypothetical protein|nr:hypothetical protein [Xanthobacteraceae bacterium]
MTYQTAAQAKQKYIAKMGNKLGPQFHELTARGDLSNTQMDGIPCTLRHQAYPHSADERDRTGLFPHGTECFLG